MRVDYKVAAPSSNTPATSNTHATLAGGKIPLNVCVAGHRDLIPAQMPAIESEVRRFFQDLQRKYPCTPLRCYSALAIGADQLVARIALELDVELIAVLPAPKQLYLDYFFEDGTRGDFDQLYARTSRTITLPLPDEYVEADLREHNQRRRLFASLGNFLTDRSLILLALYNGVDIARTGGTAWIAERKKQGRQQTGVSRFDFPETGLVYHVAIGRLGDSDTPSPVSAGYTSHLGEDVVDYMRAFSDIAKFNALSSSNGRQRNSRYPHSTEFEETVGAFAAADTLAAAEKRTLQRARLSLFVCAVIMFCMFLAYSNDEAGSQFVLFYVGAQVVGALLWLRLQRKETFQHHLSYRSFAEALRVQLSWQKSGLTDQVVDHFQRKHRVKSRWIRLALRALASDEILIEKALWSNLRDGAAVDQEALRSVKAEWIDPALEHYRDAARRRGRNAGISKGAAKVLYSIGVCSGFGALLASIYPAAITPVFEHGLVICMGAMPGLAALILSFADNQGWEEDSAYSEHMADVFSRCVILWDSVSRRDLVREVGKENLRHNGDWLSLHASRKLKSPSL